MLWQLQLLLAWLLSPQAINLFFAIVTLALAFGADQRVVAVVLALLYLALVVG